MNLVSDRQCHRGCYLIDSDLCAREAHRISFFFLTVKKTKAETAAQKEWHTAREKLRKERREEQDRNVQRKRALAGKTKADAVGSADDEVTDDEGGSDGSEDGGEASWDEEEEISEGEVSDDDDTRNEVHGSEDEDDEGDKPSRKKKPKVK